jgi:uroporphyrinogen-III synthase
MNLTKKRIVITRPRAQAQEFADALLLENAKPLFFPVIEITPLNDFSFLDKAFLDLDQYDWLILTSVHGVDVFFERLKSLDIGHIPQRLQVAAIGAKTASRLSLYGVTPKFIPNEYTAEGSLDGLQENISGKRFLLPQSDLAREVLTREIRSAGGIADEITVYHTKIMSPDLSTMEDLYSGMDVVTFASPSSVKGFIQVLVEHNLDVHHLPGNPLIACIGPVTSAAAREAGLLVDIEAKEHTIDGLISALKQF